jgi:hypothetical protein
MTAAVQQSAPRYPSIGDATKLPPVTGHPTEFGERDSDTASVSEHRERPLKVFAIDPSRGTGSRNIVTLRLPFEVDLEPGPVGRLVAVIDEDGVALDEGPRRKKPIVYPKVDLNAPEILLAGGLEPSEMDLQSHQQMVYAVAMRTIGAFERALSRPIVWHWANDPKKSALEQRLRIYPHAGEMINAYYSPADGALYFGYFRRPRATGTGESSEIVYTALGYDLTAHEVVHPILESVVGRVTTPSVDVMALQEGIADLVALLLHFEFHDLVVDTVTRTGGRIHDPQLAADLESGSAEHAVQAELGETNPLLEIGGQFGQALGNGAAVRLALSGKPDPALLATTEEPHARGAILLAAVFDAFITIYARRTADLRRVGNVTGPRPVISQDLALRMTAEATKTAQHFLGIAIRALGHVTFTDFSLGDYLGALIKADYDAMPTDDWGYREAVIASFRARGIVPEGVTSLTTEGVRWWFENKGTRSRRAGLPDVGREKTPPPERRILKTFAFDPSAGTTPGNRLEVTVPYERLDPGPIGRLVAVVDYDASNDRYYPSVDLEQPELLRRNGLQPSDIDPQFHQQMVYAVVMSTIERFETALGREIRWPWAGRETKGKLGDRLRLYPHAMQEPNAYYDRELRGLLFGYFSASAENPGRNLPGQTVFTCLSADIVAHETTHALLDSVQPHFLERTSFDTPAFHEALADVVSLLGHFTYPEALLDTIQRTGGLIQRDLLNPDVGPIDELGRVNAERSRRNPLVDLALQFGEALGNRSALRSALGRRPDPAELPLATEAHERGAILVAAIFDAFFSVYLRRVADLLRIGRASGAISALGDIHPDLARRLAKEATDTATRISSIAARALDFCPPVDIEFGDFLRAVVTSDYERSPDDPLGFRSAFVDGFRDRGIYARTAKSMTEEGLRWDRAPAGLRVEGLVPIIGAVANPRDLARNAIAFRDFSRANAEVFGLDAGVPIRVSSIQSSTSQTVDRSGTARTEVKCQIVQQRLVPLDPIREGSPVFKFRGGSTVVLDGAGNVTYVISKRIASGDRLRRVRDYLLDDVSQAAAAGYRAAEIPTRASLAALHRGL